MYKSLWDATLFVYPVVVLAMQYRMTHKDLGAVTLSLGPLPLGVFLIRMRIRDVNFTRL